MVTRITVVIALILVLLVGAIWTASDAAEKRVTIGVLSPDSREMSGAVLASFRRGLRDLGWEEGRNIIIEIRFADGDLERLRDLADELLKLEVSIIVAQSSPGARAAAAATKTVPIIFVGSGIPSPQGW